MRFNFDFNQFSIQAQKLLLFISLNISLILNFFLFITLVYFAESSDVPQPKKPRRELRSRRTSTTYRRSEHILPAECIICQKAVLDVKIRGKRTKERLSSCQYVDGGQLLEQAVNEQNTRILRLIQGQDCVAIEVKYHATCFRNFTRPLSYRRDEHQPFQQSKERQYDQTFKLFCEDIIDQKLIAEKKV